MNGFHAHWRFISAQDRARTIGKKIANSTVGKTTSRPLRSARRRDPSEARGRRRGLAARACARMAAVSWHHRPPGRAAALSVVLALALTLAIGDSAAQAGCGNAKYAQPTKRSTDGRPPLVIGDSVLLGAIPQVAAAGFEVNTRGCRPMSEGLGIIAARKRAKTLPHFVIIALGANGSITKGDIREAMKLVGPDRVLGLMTPRELG